jgi:hypothetical protein
MTAHVQFYRQFLTNIRDWISNFRSPSIGTPRAHKLRFAASFTNFITQFKQRVPGLKRSERQANHSPQRLPGVSLGHRNIFTLCTFYSCFWAVLAASLRCVPFYICFCAVLAASLHCVPFYICFCAVLAASLRCVLRIFLCSSGGIFTLYIPLRLLLCSSGGKLFLIRFKLTDDLDNITTDDPLCRFSM